MHTAIGVLVALSLNVAQPAPTVRILPALPSPQAVGTVVGLTVIPKEEGDPLKVLGKLRFRYSVSVDGSEFHLLSDFSRNPGFAWRPELYEHQALIRATVKNTDTGQTGEVDLPFRVVSRVKGEQPLATPTANPLVALFSSAACPEGSQFRVAFKREGDTEVARTGSEPCRGSRTSNMYVAGMRADSLYDMHAEIVTGAEVTSGPSVQFHTGIADGKLAPLKVTNPGDPKTVSSEPLLLFSMEEPVTRPIAADMNGNLVWYLAEPDVSLARMLSGGRFLVFRAGGNDENSRLQMLSEVDLAGNILRETNITRVAEQLGARGMESVCRPNGHQCIPGFHHDSIRLPNGHTLAIASLERMFPAGGQGSKDPTDILGVLLVDLGADLQLQWYWNAFDHLDLKRAALGDEKCKGTTGGGGCPPVFLAPSANDWLHGNAVAYSRADGNILLSLPEQDWLVKIDYRDGKGTGKVLWRLGEEGDFTAKSSDPHPWFSYQHDSGFEPPGSDTLVLLDNGQRRQKKDPKTTTRGQMWKIDEKTRIATLLMNADLGVYSPWVGSAQRLSNGNFHFMTGAVLEDTSFSGRCFETSPEGTILRALQISGTLMYRGNRIANLYTPPNR